ncbi:MAG: OmpH family outer membrane protein [Paludibacteraceae bacterium]|nr:OmpH family outer membrane protein [Paludibacteraceae bacterium]
MMKDIILYVINGILAVAVVVLFVLFATRQPQQEERVVTAEGQLPVAYVNMDTLLLNYHLYNTMSEELLREEERSRATINQKANQLQADAADFQKKLENNAFLSEARARSEQERLLKKQRELQELDNRLSQELVAKQTALNEKLNHIVDSVVVEYNKEKQYQLIFSNAGHAPLLYADKAFDVTQEILERLNADSTAVAE